jgi:hypothetical protein
VIELGRLHTQIGFDVAQTLAEGQPREGHGAKMLGSTEVTQPEIAAILGHAAGKFDSG